MAHLQPPHGTQVRETLPYPIGTRDIDLYYVRVLFFTLIKLLIKAHLYFEDVVSCIVFSVHYLSVKQTKARISCELLL